MSHSGRSYCCHVLTIFVYLCHLFSGKSRCRTTTTCASHILTSSPLLLSHFYLANLLSYNSATITLFLKEVDLKSQALFVAVVIQLFIHEKRSCIYILSCIYITLPSSPPPIIIYFTLKLFRNWIAIATLQSTKPTSN